MAPVFGWVPSRSFLSCPSMPPRCNCLGGLSLQPSLRPFAFLSPYTPQRKHQSTLPLIIILCGRSGAFGAFGASSSLSCWTVLQSTSGHPVHRLLVSSFFWEEAFLHKVHRQPLLMPEICRTLTGS